MKGVGTVFFLLLHNLLKAHHKPLHQHSRAGGAQASSITQTAFDYFYERCVPGWLHCTTEEATQGEPRALPELRQAWLALNILDALRRLAERTADAAADASGMRAALAAAARSLLQDAEVWQAMDLGPARQAFTGDLVAIMLAAPGRTQRVQQVGELAATVLPAVTTARTSKQSVDGWPSISGGTFVLWYRALLSSLQASGRSWVGALFLNVAARKACWSNVCMHASVTRVRCVHPRPAGRVGGDLRRARGRQGHGAGGRRRGLGAGRAAAAVRSVLCGPRGSAQGPSAQAAGVCILDEWVWRVVSIGRLCLLRVRIPTAPHLSPSHHP